MSQVLRKILAENVRKIREERGLRKEQLSLLLNLDNSYISKLEKARVNITIDRIEQIADFFNVDYKELFSPQKKSVKK